MPAPVAHLPARRCAAGARRWRASKIEDAVDRIKTEAGDLPLIAVGGGAFLIPDRLAGISRGDPRRAWRLRQRGRCRDRPGQRRDRPDLSRPDPHEAIAAAEAQALDRAVAAGADRDNLETIEIEDMPLAYLPGNALRVRVRVAGEMGAKPAA